MRWLLGVLTIVMISVIAVPMVAQGDPDEMGGEDIPRCTQLELLQISIPFGELVESYQDLEEGAEDTLENRGDRLELLVEYAELQQAWWDDIYPDWPKCAFVVEAGLWIGRVLDETVITIALFDVDTDMATEHLERLLELRSQFDLVVARGLSLMAG